MKSLPLTRPSFSLACSPQVPATPLYVLSVKAQSSNETFVLSILEKCFLCPGLISSEPAGISCFFLDGSEESEDETSEEDLESSLLFNSSNFLLLFLESFTSVECSSSLEESLSLSLDDDPELLELLLDEEESLSLDDDPELLELLEEEESLPLSLSLPLDEELELLDEEESLSLSLSLDDDPELLELLLDEEESLSLSLDEELELLDEEEESLSLPLDEELELLEEEESSSLESLEELLEDEEAELSSLEEPEDELLLDVEEDDEDDGFTAFSTSSFLLNFGTLDLELCFFVLIESIASALDTLLACGCKLQQYFNGSTFFYLISSLMDFSLTFSFYVYDD